MRSEFTCDWHANCSLSIRCCRRARRSLCHLEHNPSSEAGSSCYYYLIPTRSLFSTRSNQQGPIPLWPWESITNSKLEVSEWTRASILFLSFFHYVFLIPTAIHQPDLKFHGDRDHVFYFIHSTSTDWPPAMGGTRRPGEYKTWENQSLPSRKRQWPCCEYIVLLSVAISIFKAILDMSSFGCHDNPEGETELVLFPFVCQVNWDQRDWLSQSHSIYWQWSLDYHPWFLFLPTGADGTRACSPTQPSLSAQPCPV